MIEVHDRGHGGARSRRARTTIDGLSVVGAFAILAETGDPSRVPSPRTSLTHAGRAPRANESGNFRSQTTSGRGRPARRAQRASSGLLPHTAGRSPRRAPAAVGRHSTQRRKARAAPARLRRHDPRHMERRQRLRPEGGGAGRGRRRHWRGRGEPDWTGGRTRSGAWPLSHRARRRALQKNPVARSVEHGERARAPADRRQTQPFRSAHPHRADATSVLSSARGARAMRSGDDGAGPALGTPL